MEKGIGMKVNKKKVLSLMEGKREEAVKEKDQIERTYVGNEQKSSMSINRIGKLIVIEKELSGTRRQKVEEKEQICREYNLDLTQNFT